jgi:hypothetical protein
MLQEEKKGGRQNLNRPALPKGTRERRIDISCCRSPGTALLDSEICLDQWLAGSERTGRPPLARLRYVLSHTDDSAALKASQDGRTHQMSRRTDVLLDGHRPAFGKGRAVPLPSHYIVSASAKARHVASEPSDGVSSIPCCGRRGAGDADKQN